MTRFSSSSGQDVTPGKSAADAPASAMPAEPEPMAPDKSQTGQDMKPVAIQRHQKTSNEEPEMALEADLPSDGRDEKGDAMIRDLPQRPELSEPPSQPDPSSNKS